MEGNDIKISSITANYFGTIINIPHYSVATENDPYAYELYSWSDGTDNGAEIHMLQRCVCTEATCGEWAGQCNPWGYWDGPQYQVTDFCDCWHEVEDTTFTITYETEVTEEIEQYGGFGYSAYNGAGLYSNTTSLWTETTVPLPGIIKKEDRQPEGSLVKYKLGIGSAKKSDSSLTKSTSDFSTSLFALLISNNLIPSIVFKTNSLGSLILFRKSYTTFLYLGVLIPAS